MYFTVVLLHYFFLFTMLYHVFVVRIPGIKSLPIPMYDSLVTAQ